MFATMAAYVALHSYLLGGHIRRPSTRKYFEIVWITSCWSRETPGQAIPNACHKLVFPFIYFPFFDSFVNSEFFQTICLIRKNHKQTNPFQGIESLV